MNTTQTRSPYDIYRIGEDYRTALERFERHCNKENFTTLTETRAAWLRVTKEERAAAQSAGYGIRPRKVTPEQLAQYEKQAKLNARQEQGTPEHLEGVAEYHAATRVAAALERIATEDGTAAAWDDALTAWNKASDIMHTVWDYYRRRDEEIGETNAEVSYTGVYLKAREVCGSQAWHEYRKYLANSIKPAGGDPWGREGHLLSSLERERERLARAQEEFHKAAALVEDTRQKLHAMNVAEWQAQGLDREAAEAAAALTA
jgi:hypothetical protein